MLELISMDSHALGSEVCELKFAVATQPPENRSNPHSIVAMGSLHDLHLYIADTHTSSPPSPELKAIHRH
jgi:hypothetical protein